MSFDVLANATCCAIILDNMCLKECDEFGTDFGLEDDHSGDFVVCGGVSPIWWVIVHQHWILEVYIGIGSPAAPCEAHYYMEDGSKHRVTKIMLMAHMWRKYDGK